MELNLQMILNSLSWEASMKAGESISFTFDNWSLTLTREEDKYKPYTFSLSGNRPFTFNVSGKTGHSFESWGRRYVNMEQAFLHVLNGFNENAYINNKYKSLDDIVTKFPHDKRNKNLQTHDNPMDLRTFLSYFDFDYDIVPPGGKDEDKIRQELIEDGKLSVEEAAKDLICLIDCQGAYFGDIGKERYPISVDSVDKIIDRMNIYINEFEEEFREALDVRDVDISALSFEEMVEKCKELGVGNGEVSYSLAEFLVHSEKITIKEVLAKEEYMPGKKPSLADQILSADRRQRAEEKVSDVLTYDRETAQRCEDLAKQGLVDVLTPQESANLIGKPVMDGKSIYYPASPDADLGR